MSQKIVHLRMSVVSPNSKIDFCCFEKLAVMWNHHLVLELLGDVSYRHTALSNDLIKDIELGQKDNLN